MYSINTIYNTIMKSKTISTSTYSPLNFKFKKVFLNIKKTKLNSNKFFNLGFNLKSLILNSIHIGQHSRFWNPNLRMYFSGVRHSIMIFDLVETHLALRSALFFIKNIIKKGGSLLFVGTREDIQNIIQKEALKCEQPYIISHWYGGTLTNYNFVSTSVKVKDNLKKDLFNKNILADAVWIPDPIFDHISVSEATSLNIPIIGICDSNDEVRRFTYPITGNRSSTASIKFFTYLMSLAVQQGIKENLAKKSKSKNFINLEKDNRNYKLVKKLSSEEFIKYKKKKLFFNLVKNLKSTFALFEYTVKNNKISSLIIGEKQKIEESITRINELRNKLKIPPVKDIGYIIKKFQKLKLDLK